MLIDDEAWQWVFTISEPPEWRNRWKRKQMESDFKAKPKCDIALAKSQPPFCLPTTDETVRDST